MPVAAGRVLARELLPGSAGGEKSGMWTLDWLLAELRMIWGVGRVVGRWCGF